MTQKVLILGGQGRVGYSVALDILSYTSANVIITGREQKINSLPPRMTFLPLTLENIPSLVQAIANSDLVIHCAGPFHHRDQQVLQLCITHKVNYIDISDHRSYYQKLTPYQDQVKSAGITAVTNTGIFPGISNSMVKAGIEALDHPEKIHLSYVVAGSGGAGLTVMRSTFLGLRQSFPAFLNGQWQTVKPYTEREIIEFPHYGKTGVYWFDMPETYTFTESFPVKTVITKFGSIPDFYNHLTWITAHVFPPQWIESDRGIEFFSNVSYKMTTVTDKFTGIGVAMRADITGIKNNQPAQVTTMMDHQNTAICAGAGAGMVAQFLLEGKLTQIGIYPVEQVLPTDLFQVALDSRNIKIVQKFHYLSSDLRDSVA